MARPREVSDFVAEYVFNDLHRNGVPPTIRAFADALRVSQRTAWRYRNRLAAKHKRCPMCSGTGKIIREKDPNRRKRR